MARLREMRGGRDNDARFGTRMTGEGLWAELMQQRLRKACARLGLSQERRVQQLGLFRPPVRAAAPPRPAPPMAQGELF